MSVKILLNILTGLATLVLLVAVVFGLGWVLYNTLIGALIGFVISLGTVLAFIGLVLYFIGDEVRCRLTGRDK